MRRTRLSWLLTLLWLVSFGLAMLAAVALAPGPWLYLALGACAPFPILSGWIIARAADRRERAVLSALGEATGMDAMGKSAPLAYTRDIVASLCVRLERARLYQTAFEQSSAPALIAAKDGTILKLSAGIAARAPECAETETVAALLGAEVPQRDRPMRGRVRFAGYDWQATSLPLGGERWLVMLDRPGVVVAEGDWQAMTEALAGGETGFRFSVETLEGNPDLEAVNLGFAVLDRSALALASLARDGELAAIMPSNDGFAPQIHALADAMSSLARARDEEAEAGRNARARLDRIAALVEMCRRSAFELTAAAEAARLASDGAREGFDAGKRSAAHLAETGSGIRDRAAMAGDAARKGHENVAAVGALAREIDELVSGIEEVSFRTNLLALNAAVEAARAGEKGAGFAVVAAEVRELAQKSSKTSKTIRGLVSRSLAEAGAGSAQAETLVAALADMDAHLLNLSDETARMEMALEGGGRALATVDAQAGMLLEAARDQAEALSGDGDGERSRDGSKARRV